MMRDKVEQAIEGLDRHLRAALLLRTQYTYGKSAAILGISTATLRDRVREAKRKVLDELLGPAWEDAEVAELVGVHIDAAAARLRKREATIGYRLGAWLRDMAVWVRAAVANRFVPVWPRVVGVVGVVCVMCVAAYVGMNRSADGPHEAAAPPSPVAPRSPVAPLFLVGQDEERNAGDAVAQFELGRLLATGAEGVDQDYREAANWLGRAANQGHAAAQFDLGRLYANGTGVDRDDDEAARWFRSAADQGHLEAQLELRKLTGPR